MPDPNYSHYTDDPEEAVPQSDQGGEDSKTALVPKAFCPGAAVGDEITARVVAVHEAEFELEYVDSNKSDEEKPEPPMEHDEPVEPSNDDSMLME